ncbi:rab GTPase-binding effector protein 1-like isoform X2 [Oculina patagonica]
MDDQENNAEDLPDDINVLRATIQDLKRRENQLLKNREQSEIEFGQRRAKFKELYMAREEELAKEKSKLKTTQEEARKLRNELQRVLAEGDGYRAAAALAESSQKEELETLRAKYQEEIVSLQAIMSEAVREAKESAAEHFEIERHNLNARNQRLENEVKNLKSLLSSDEESSSGRPRMLSGLSDAVVGAIRRNTATSQTSSVDGEAVPDVAKTLEKSMEKELSFMKAKLKDAQEKLKTAEAKIKEGESKKHEKKSEEEESLSRETFEELQEKVKELNQYLESERSSRTDLEMYVAVLNTQKGVLQEDAEKLRKELHNVCRLLEQEKMSHNDLKQTWEMANVQFVENLRVQGEAFSRVWNILTPDQRTTVQQQQQQPQPQVDQQQQQQPQVGQLIDLQSPQTSPQPTNQQPSFVPQQVSIWDNIPTVPCTNQLGSEVENTEDNKDSGLRRAHSASDLTLSQETSSTEVSRARSVEELLSSSPEPVAASNVPPPEGPSSLPARPRVPSKGSGGKFDWKNFQEAVKVSHESSLSRSCAMCGNYERQLQKMQDENQKFQNLASNLQVALDQEKKELFKEQKMRNKLEESVARAAEDAQMQINTHAMTNNKLEKLVAGLRENFEATKHGAQTHIMKLVASRDQLTQELTKLRTDYAALQDNAIQQLTQMDSDARLAEMREQLMQIRAASEGTEEKLRSEVSFLKDRVMAEQVAKDSLEAMLQGDVDNIRAELDTLRVELEKEKRAKAEAHSQLRKSDQSLKNTEDKSKQVIIALRGQLDEANEEKSKAEDESKQLKNQLQSMTEQLNQSETVQRDFVRLSQSLQMQIAQIHESETDVRWQHPEDIKACQNCQKPLKSNKEKHHCHHCGKVFCEQCTSKTVLGSKSSKPHPVCNNCYVILNKDSTSTFYNTTLADDNR